MLEHSQEGDKGVGVSPASSPFHPPSAPLRGLCRRVPVKGLDPVIGTGAPMSRPTDNTYD